MENQSGEAFVVCDCCRICIGPDFLYSTPVILDTSTLCGGCHASLVRRGYLELSEIDKLKAYKIMKIDGSISLVDQKKMKKLKTRGREEIIRVLGKI